MLQKMVDAKASDMFVTAGMPVAAKINGELLPIEEVPLSADDALAIVLACMNDKQKNEYLAHKECNFAIANDARPVSGFCIFPARSGRHGSASYCHQNSGR